MGSGASKDSKDIKEEQMINTDEYEPIKNWQGEVSWIFSCRLQSVDFARKDG